MSPPGMWEPATRRRDSRLPFPFRVMGDPRSLVGRAQFSLPTVWSGETPRWAPIWGTGEPRGPEEGCDPHLEQRGAVRFVGVADTLGICLEGRL